MNLLVKSFWYIANCIYKVLKTGTSVQKVTQKTCLFIYAVLQGKPMIGRTYSFFVQFPSTHCLMLNKWDASFSTTTEVVLDRLY